MAERGKEKSFSDATVKKLLSTTKMNIDKKISDDVRKGTKDFKGQRGKVKKAPVSKRNKGSKILNQTQISETAFIVVRMETLAVGKSGSNVRVVESGIMNRLILV